MHPSSCNNKAKNKLAKNEANGSRLGKICKRKNKKYQKEQQSYNVQIAHSFPKLTFLWILFKRTATAIVSTMVPEKIASTSA